MSLTQRLDEACLITMGQAPPGESYNQDGDGLPLIAGAGDFGELHPVTKKFTSSPGKVCAPGDIVLGIRATIGEKVVADRDYCLGRGVAGLRAKDGLNSRFLWHWLSHSAPLLASKAKGATFKQVNREDIGGLLVPLPPLPEQRRIAEILDKADALRAKRRAALSYLDTLSQSIFLDMFGDPATNPKGWPVVSVGDICEVRGGKRLPKGEEYSSVPTPFRYIRVVDIKGGRIDDSALVYLKPEIQAEIARYVVNAGDVIISIAGSIGLVSTVPESLNGVNLTENAAKLVPRKNDQYEADYLAAYLATEHAQREIGSYIGQVTIGKLALFRIEKLKVPLPPRDLQRGFIQRISALNTHAALHIKARLRLDALFASLQHRAFRGEL